MAETPRMLFLVVATPTGVAVRADVESVQVPGVQGELGILPGHLPLLSALKPGVLRYRAKDKNVAAAVDSGYVEVRPTSVSVLTARHMAPDKIEPEAAKKELAEAEEKLKTFPGLHEGAEHAEVLRAIDWARALVAVSTNVH